MKEMKEMKKIRGFPDQNESLKFPVDVCGWLKSFGDVKYQISDCSENGYLQFK